MRTLAWLAEAAGVDLRIVVLRRRAACMLESLERRYPVGSMLQQSLTMADKLFALHGQLGLIDSAFYRCADNALFNSSARVPEWALWLRSFVHPAMPWSVVAVLLRSVRRNSPECRENEDASQPGTAVWRVAQAQAALDPQCASAQAPL